MVDKNGDKKVRSSTSFGLTAVWTVGQDNDGAWRIKGISEVMNGSLVMPVTSIPLKLRNAAIQSPAFQSAEHLFDFIKRL